MGTETAENEEFNFWQDHSLEFLEMALKRDFQERVDHPDGYGTMTRECGDTIEFFLMEKKGRLHSISYDTRGCSYSNACANTVIFLAQNRLVPDAWKITYEDIVNYLKTLPTHEEHCAKLAVGAFYLALRDLADHGSFKAK